MNFSFSLLFALAAAALLNVEASADRKWSNFKVELPDDAKAKGRGKPESQNIHRRRLINPDMKEVPKNARELTSDDIVESAMDVVRRESKNPNSPMRKNKNRSNKGKGRGRGRRNADDTATLWSNGRVPYTIDSSLDSTARSAIAAAIQDLESSTCVRFVERTSESNYLWLFQGQGCYSYIGSIQQAQQPVSIGAGCEYKGIVIHELLHALGFQHEQSRVDRDNFVRVNWANIRSGAENNFEKMSSQHDLGIAYDYSSVLHYGRTSFSVNGQDTLTPLQSNVVIGQRQGLSESDIEEVNGLYCGGGGSGPAPPPLPQCENYASNCMDYLFYCWHSTIQTYCPKMCNLC